ncbi:MAG TPA: hypothetical protein VF473_04855 [Cyclobacteriaceae bacterium]
MTTSGVWTNTANWVSGNIGDNVTETVTIDNNVNPTLNSPTNLYVGTVTLTNNNTLTVSSGATLNIGDATHTNNLITTNNNTTMTIAGTLVVWGDLQVNNNVVWNITGSVIIKGSIIMNNNAALNVTGGTLQVGGNFTAGQNATISVPSGSISVSGSMNVGSGSTLSGCTGCTSVGGGCTGPSSFCSNSALPITLLSFEGKTTGPTITLDWSTASELNFDKFVIEKSGALETFAEIGSVAGHGNSNVLNEYSFEDELPAAGMNYYRLRSVDFDGKSENSKVIRVEFKGNADHVRLYPNPVTDGTFAVKTSFAKQEGDKVMVYNNVGVLVGESLVSTMDVTLGKTFTTGLYTLFYVTGGMRYPVRFVVK